MTTQPESADARRRALLHPDQVRVYPLDFPATVPQLLHRAVERFGDLEVLVTADERVTFAEIDRRSRLLARHLVAAGVGKGTRVAILLPQGPAWVEGFLALARIGALSMCVNTFLKPPELRRVLRHADAQFLLAPERLSGRPTGAFLDDVSPGLSVAMEPSREARLPDLPYLRSVFIVRPDDLPHEPIDDELLDAMEAQVSPADWLVTVYTSGTTSDPKAVIHTHGTEVRHSANLVELRGLSPAWRMFAVLPFFWIGGLMYELLPALHSGAMIVTQERFDPAGALDLIERERTNSFMGYANARERIMSEPSYPERDLRDVPFLPPLGTPPVDPRRFHNSLGMTESNGPHTMGAADTFGVPLPEEHWGSFGPPVPFVEHRIADPDTNETLPDAEEGEICLRGYSVLTGMYKREREEVFDAEGWYHTGDRGYFRDGLLFFTGRADEMIRTGGSNVSPREVELALELAPDVEIALVFGLPDPVRGEVVVAGVVPARGAAFDEGGLLDGLRKELSSYKMPTAIVELAPDDVPFGVTGKAERRKVAVTLQEKLAARA
ncbi:MAG TPA: class I adenylate-forming enzyme family protein [Acidimicrobiales bacterium]